MEPASINLANDYPPVTPEIILELFQNFRSSDNEQVQSVNKQLIFYKENFPGEALLIASNFLMDDSYEDYVFQFSAIYINNILSPTLYVLEVNNRYTFWKKLDEETRNSIKQGTFRGLMYSNSVIRSLCAKAISLIARIEVKNSNYPDLFDNIFQIIFDDQFGEWAKIGGIQAIKELLLIHTKKDPVIPKNANIEEIGSNIFQITTTVLQNQQVSDEFKNEAADCLRVSLPYFASFIQDQFKTLLEFILSILPIGVTAYKLLLKFCKTFYDQLATDPMKQIFDEVSKDIESVDPNRQILAINFWYRFSKYEFKILSRDQEIHNISNQLSEAFSQPFLNILPNAVGEFDASLFEEANLNELPDVIICCLKQFAQISQNQETVANNVVNFFQEFHSNENPIYRYSSILSLQTIVFIDTQEQLTDFFVKSIDILTDIISKDASTNVRCISILLLGKIFAHQIDPNSETPFAQLFDFITELLNDTDTTILTSVCKMLSIIFKHCNQAFIVQLHNANIFLTLISLLDRPNIFEDQFLIFLQKAFESLFKSSPTSNHQTFEIYINTYIEVGTRLENAIKEAEFPDQECKEKMINILCSISTYVCEKFKYIPPDTKFNFGNIASHFLDILFDSITTFPDMSDTYILGAIGTMIVIDPAKVVQGRLDQVAQIIINIYTTSESMHIIKITGNIIRDLIYLYPSYFLENSVSYEGEQEKNLATHLLEFTLKCFNSILFIPFQVWIFGVVGDIIKNIDDSDYIYANEIISGLNNLKYMLVPKTDIESNNAKIRSMLYVSEILISKYNNYNIEFYKKNKGIIFSAALVVANGQNQDPNSITRFLEFIDRVLSLPKNIFSVFSIYINRSEIVSSLKNFKEIPNFTKQCNNVLVKIKRKT